MKLTGVRERRRVRPLEEPLVIHIRSSDPVRGVLVVARAVFRKTKIILRRKIVRAA